MIGMRYHVVSLAAALFALAVGVALGSGPLDNTVNAAFGVEQLREEKDQLAADVSQQQAVATFADAYADTTEPLVLPGQLTEAAVVIVTAADAPPAMVDAAREALGLADATVTGVLTLTPAYTDPEQASVLGGLVDRLATGELPDGTTSERAAAALATALLSDESGGAALAETDEALLAGLAEVGMVSPLAPVTARAGAALVLVGPTGDDATRDAVLPLLRAFADSGAGTELAGPVGSAGGGGVVAAMRTDEDLRRVVASTDAADTAAGRIVTVVALAQALEGSIGHYGTGPGTTTAAPPLE